MHFPAIPAKFSLSFPFKNSYFVAYLHGNKIIKFQHKSGEESVIQFKKINMFIQVNSIGFPGQTAPPAKN